MNEGIKIELGSEYTDSVTGFKGKATALFKQLTGPDRVQLEGLDDTGRPVEFWVDVIRLE